MKTIYFNALQDKHIIDVPVSSVFFGPYITHKSSLFLIFTYFYGFKKCTDNEFAFFVKDINEYFNLSLRISRLKEFVDEVNEQSDFLGFSISLDYDNYKIIYETSDKNKVLELYSKFKVLPIDFSKMSELTVYAIKFLLYLYVCPFVQLSVDELRKVFGVYHNAYYQEFHRFKSKVFLPSIEKLKKFVDLKYIFLRDSHGKIDQIQLCCNNEFGM